MKKTSLIFICVFICGVLTAQSFYSKKRDRNVILSVGTGTSSYYGELSNPGDYIDAKLNLNFGLQYFITERFAARAEVTWFQLAGDDTEADDPQRVNRNLSFVSNNYEVNIEGLVYLFPKGQRFYQRNLFNLYAFFGVGLANYNPKGLVPSVEYQGELLPDAGKNIALRPLQTEGVKYGNFTPVIPFGLGAKLKAGPFFNLAFEGGFRYTFSDYLDDVSTTVVDKSSASNIEAAMADKTWALPDPLPARSLGSVRGNPEKNDAYFILNVKVEYFLPSSFFSGKKNKRRKPNKRRRRRR
jgi:hypothetical protein